MKRMLSRRLSQTLGSAASNLGSSSEPPAPEPSPEQSFWVPPPAPQEDPAKAEEAAQAKAKAKAEEIERNAGICACMFPCRPFLFCGPLLMFMPNTWQNIQDFTHFSLVIGVFAGLGLIFRSVFDLYEGICFSTDELWCSREAILLFFSLSVITYIGSIIGQYDEQLNKKQADVREQKEKLLASYGDLLNDMDGLLSSATESASGLAERSFESKRRDFQRFLERAKSRFGNGLEHEDAEMLMQFRQFCLNWLKVFQECSIDPVNRPLKVVDENLLMGCMNIREVADMCLERLRVTEVRFISHQQETDKKSLFNNRQKLSVLNHAEDGAGSARMLEITAGGEVAKDSGSGANSFLERQQEASNERITWIKCCTSGAGCYCKAYGAGEDRFPYRAACGCGKLVCLSRQHAMLLGAFCFGLLVLAVDIIDELNDEVLEWSVQLFSEGALILLLWTVSVLLLNFEDLDTVQKLEREVQELKTQNENVARQSDKMKEFWHSAQNLTELWLYRTVPRLDLYKEMHSLLEDESEKDLLKSLQISNAALENLEKNMGALEMWRNDGGISTNDKKIFGKTVNELCHAGELPEMVQALEDNLIKSSVMRPLRDLHN